MSTLVSSSAGGPEVGGVAFKVDYASLYERLCATATEEAPMLLLYLLLHRNVAFRNYLLSRVNLEKLVGALPSPP